MRLIDADALKYNIKHAKALYLVEELVFKIIDKMPRVVRMNGEWVYRLRNSENDVYFCSICHSEYVSDERLDFNFCPCCGSDMRGFTNDNNYC